LPTKKMPSFSFAGDKTAIQRESSRSLE